VRVHHANLQISNPRASLEFYGHLGLTLVGCLRLDPVVLYYVGPPGGDAVLELAHNPGLQERVPGSGHVGLAVGDLDALLIALAEHGIEPERPPFHPGDRPDLRVCFVGDPDQVRVELIEGDFPLPTDPAPETILA
jgi:lactoylglutathione lyase